MSQLPTLPKPTESSRDTVKAANSGASVGGNGTKTAQSHSTSESAPTLPPSGKSSHLTDDSGIKTVGQALAVVRPGIIWLANHSQLTTLNDKKTGIAWVGFKDMQIKENGQIVPTLLSEELAESETK